MFDNDVNNNASIDRKSRTKYVISSYKNYLNGVGKAG